MPVNLVAFLNTVGSHLKVAITSYTRHVAHKKILDPDSDFLLRKHHNMNMQLRQCLLTDQVRLGKQEQPSEQRGKLTMHKTVMNSRKIGNFNAQLCLYGQIREDKQPLVKGNNYRHTVKSRKRGNFNVFLWRKRNCRGEFKGTVFNGEIKED